MLVLAGQVARPAVFSSFVVVVVVVLNITNRIT